jgi:transcriptional regulator with XRE-family HTH domain
MPIIIAQVRAARKLKNWTQALAEAAGISLSIIKNFESEHRLPTQENLMAIWSAFDEAGIAFENDGKSYGVKLKRTRMSYKKPIDAKQSLAARELLNWSRSDLSRAAQLSYGAVRNFEGEQRPTAEARLLAILRAFEKARIVFEDDGRFVVVRVVVR